jgi:hypothetical protein
VCYGNSFTFFTFFFSSIVCLINIGQLYALSVSVCSGVAFQPAHCIVSLKKLAAVSISSSVLRETFKVYFVLIKRLKSYRYVCLLLKLGRFSWFNVCAVSMIKTGKYVET